MSVPAPGYLSDPEIEPMSPALAGVFFTTVTPEKLFHNDVPPKKFSDLSADNLIISNLNFIKNRKIKSI